MSGANKDYKIGQKNNWRRTCANEIGKRLGHRLKTDLILYLPGPGDIDRDIFTERGVPCENLIAIDRNARNVGNVKENGGFGIVAEAFDVLRSWPAHRKVGAVMLDFCNGLDEKILPFGELMEHPAFVQAVWMVNIQRGHDAYTQDLRERILADVFQEQLFLYYQVIGHKYADAKKHRGYQFLVFWLMMFMRDFEGQEGWDDIELACNIWASMQPMMYSYGSVTMNGKKKVVNVFDSFICWPIQRLIFEVHDMGARDLNMWVKATHEDFRSYKQQPMVNKLAAMFAVRTKRLGGV